jgi:hypothetical protein
MPSRSNYWSCSKFADFIRGTAKLGAATSRDWRLWREAARVSHPIRYWIAEEALDWLQNVVNWPTDKLNDIRYYINNRWSIRSHALTAHPRDIRPGSWCDVGNRFLPCLFNELVNFVEVEQAWHYCIWDEAAREKYQVPWWQRNWFTRWGQQWRSPQAGLDYLDWASGLKLDSHMGIDSDHPEYGQPTHQALAAREIKELYLWWTQERPKRPDVYDASGWTEYCELRRERGADFLDLEDKTEEEAEMGRTALERSQAIEKAYEQEDEAMMIRLIRVRDALWT